MFTSFRPSVVCTHLIGIRKREGKLYINGFRSTTINILLSRILCGLTEEVQKGHIVRAALEAVCFQVRDILEAMHSDCGVPLAKLKVDGGMTANRLLLQLQADLIGLSVIKPAMVETTALVCFICLV